MVPQMITTIIAKHINAIVPLTTTDVAISIPKIQCPYSDLVFPNLRHQKAFFSGYKYSARNRELQLHVVTSKSID